MKGHARLRLTPRLASPSAAIKRGVSVYLVNPGGLPHLKGSLIPPMDDYDWPLIVEVLKPRVGSSTSPWLGRLGA